MSGERAAGGTGGRLEPPGRARPGALHGTRLSILAAEVSDPDRFRRGRVYLREGAVQGVAVVEGEVVGHVQGSERTPYVVVLATRPWHPGASPVPTRDEVSSRCTCPDGALVCKHAVAVLLTFADRVAAEPALLERWRRVDLAASAAAAEAPPEFRAPSPKPQPPRPARDEPDVLGPFFGPRPEGSSRWIESVLEPLDRPARSVTATDLELAALDALDEAHRALQSLYG